MLFAFAIPLGVTLGLALLLNRRDQRDAALLATVGDLTPRHLRQLVSIQVRCSLFSRRCAVTVDMGACTPEEIWGVVLRWPPRLPPHVRLLVRGTMCPGVPATITIESAGPSAPWGPCGQRMIPG